MFEPVASSCYSKEKTSRDSPLVPELTSNILQNSIDLASNYRSFLPSTIQSPTSDYVE